MNIQQVIFEFIERMNATYGRTNLLYEPRDEHTFQLPTEMVEFLTVHQTALRVYVTGLRPDHRATFATRVATYATHKTLDTLMALNQFVDVDQSFVNHIQKAHETVVSDLLGFLLSANSGGLRGVLPRVRRYQDRLRTLVGVLDEFRAFSSNQRYLEPVPCFEYSPSLQYEVLGLQPDALMEPVLDMGCGTHASLVYDLRTRGLHAYGIDRSVEKSAWTLPRSWFEAPLAPLSWGTIVAHLSVTNHCRRHHAKPRGKYVEYALLYRQILRALKIGGSLYYTPDLPFLEQHLVPACYQVRRRALTTRSVNAFEKTLHAVHITKHVHAFS